MDTEAIADRLALIEERIAEADEQLSDGEMERLRASVRAELSATSPPHLLDHLVRSPACYAIDECYF
jgi:hypothetical protein